ncbi:MAG: PKD domain-containing protein, partial [Halobacteriaceae archaeon]
MSDLSLRRRALLRGSAGTLGAGALATTTVSAAAEALSLDVSLVGEVPSGPGEEATLAVTVRNETDRSLRVVLDYHDAASSCCHVQGDCSRMLPPPPIPTENVVDHSDAGAAYDPVSWEWDSLPAGSERRVTVTFTLPSELPAGAEDLSFGAAAPSLCDVEGLDPFASASVPIPAAGTSLSAAFSYSPTNPAVGETVTLDARASAPMDAPIEAFDWDVGDDGTVDATGDVATVTFDEGGDHPVSLRVTERITRTVRGRTVTVPLTDDVTKTVTVREPSPLTTTPSTLDFGTTVAGTTRTTSLSVENRADESVRVSEIDTPTGLAVVPDCEVNYWFVEYGCDPTPPFDVGANGETTVTVSFTAPTAGIVSAVEGPATVRTADGGVSVPVTAASIASARTLATFEATAREFATFLGTGRDAGAAAVGDEVVGMYEDVIQFAGNRIGRQYRDA